MGLISGIRDRLGRPVSVVYRVPTQQTVLNLTTEEVYNSQPALQAVVSFLARNIAQLPPKCYLRTADQDRPRDTTGTAPLLLGHPNSYLTTYELVERLVLDVKLYGWAVWLVIPSADTPSGWEIDPIPAAWVNDTTTADGFTLASVQYVNPDMAGSPVVLDASQLVIFRMPDPVHPIIPASPISALKDVLAEQVSSLTFRNQVWKNGGRINSYLTRPMDAKWTPEQRDRWIKSWKHKFSGNDPDSDDTGGTPLLEDGMELKAIQFNAKDAEWSTAITLSRQDVAGVYHVNPAMVWSNDGQTYASAKENARSLYVDTLGPDLQMIENRLNQFLLPMIGAPAEEYVEFDVNQKLRGNFEDQAAQIQTSVGAPWMTRNEARALANLPKLDDGDKLVTPLNVVTGGLASPTDTAPKSDVAYREVVRALTTLTEAVKAGSVSTKDAEPAHTPLKSRGHPSQDASQAMASTLRTFFRRQRKKVVPAIDRATDKKADDGSGDDMPSWWDSDRWNKELGDDLAELFQTQATASAQKALADLQLDPSAFDEPRIVNYIKAMAAGKAQAVNDVTLRQLKAALDDDTSDDAQGSTPDGVFDKAEDSRSDSTGLSFATAVASWGVMEACRQQASDRQVQKTWIVTSGNPRASHAAMDGETVGIDEQFSNGADWPGDSTLDADETCGCTCEVEVSIP